MDELKSIVEGGYCIGCGVCRSVDSEISIRLTEQGMYQADSVNASPDKLQDVLKVCPFSNSGMNEDELGSEYFGECDNRDPRVGYYNALYAGHVEAGDYRARGASGGVISWLCCELLERGLTDYVLHVKPARRDTDGCLFKYGISETPGEVLAGSKSRYYPVELSKVLAEVKKRPGRYVLVGLPCFVKAVRNLMSVDSVIRDRIKFCVGVICGHLKSVAFADSYGWQVGIEPGRLEAIDFRVKEPEKKASNYSVLLKGQGQEIVRPVNTFFGANWGLNFFRYPACNYCDDVFGESADITVGDAWLKQYIQDSGGTSVVVVRNKELAELIAFACQNGVLKFDSLDADEIAFSQAGGLRDRGEGLAYRLYLRQKQGDWVPDKRIKPEKQGLSWKRRKIYENRMMLESESHRLWQEAVNRNSYGLFRSGMQKLVRVNHLLYSTPRKFLVMCAKKLLKKLGLYSA